MVRCLADNLSDLRAQVREEQDTSQNVIVLSCPCGCYLMVRCLADDLSDLRAQVRGEQETSH